MTTATKTRKPKAPRTKKPAAAKKPLVKRRQSKAQAAKAEEKVIKKVTGKKKAIPDQIADQLLSDTGPDQDQIEVIKKKSEEAAVLLKRMNKGEELLSSLKSAYHTLVSEDIPKRMAAAHLLSFTLEDGTDIRLSDIMSGSLPKNPFKRKEAIELLHELEAEGLLAPSINIILAVGEEPIAKKAILACKRIGNNKKKVEALIKAGIKKDDIEALKVIGQRAEVEHKVHHSTLCKFGRELLESGKDVDVSKLGLYSGKVAKIKLPAEE